MTIPQHGTIISFTRVPLASYCKAGVPYRVERPAGKGDVRLVNVERGTSTYERPAAMRTASWQEVQA